jgi:brefeldin A-inhibited guanine nucleotide-exchange protein
MQHHFNFAGSHVNTAVATFAIDSLRQLSMKFLERDELSKYHTQNEFLKPFEYIMSNGKSMDAFELVFNSILQMVNSKGTNIRSGWKTVFIVFGKLATSMKTNQSDHAINLAVRGFNQAKAIVHEHFRLMIAGDAFSEVVNCFFQFSNIVLHKKMLSVVQSEAVGMLKYCAVEITKGWDTEANEPLDKQDPDNGESVEVDKRDLNASSKSEESLSAANSVTRSNLSINTPFTTRSEANFFLSHYPILLALCRLVNEFNAVNVRAEGLEILFFIIGEFSHFYNLNCWKAIFRSTVFPIWDELRPNLNESQSTSANAKTSIFPVWIQAMRLVLDIFRRKFQEFEQGSVERQEAEWMGWFQETLDIVLLMACYHPSELVTDAGVICFFNQIIEECGSKIAYEPGDRATEGDKEESIDNLDDWKYEWWLKVTQTLEKMFKETLPVELVSVKADEPTSPTSQVATGSYQRGLAKCRSHLSLLQCIWTLLVGTGTSNSAHNPSGTPGEHKHCITELVPYDLIITRWLPSLHSSFEFAKAFNEDYDLRLSLFKQGIVKQMPKLVKQETLAIQILIILGHRVSRLLTKIAHGPSQPPLSEKTQKAPLSPTETNRESTTPWFCFSFDNISLQEKSNVLHEFLMKEADFVLKKKFVALFSSQHQMYKRQADIEAWGGVLLVIYQQLNATLSYSQRTPSENAPHGHMESTLQAHDLELLRKHIPMYFEVAVKILGFGFGVDLGPCAGEIIGTEIGKVLCDFVTLASKVFMRLLLIWY